MADKIIKDSHKTLLEQLKQPFDPRFVKWRVGATNREKTQGIALAYIDAREIKKRFDDVLGIFNWQDRLTAIDGGFVSEIDVRIDGEWITRSNAAGNTKVEPIKGGASDAFKRAAAKWGPGHYLYYLPNVWVDIRQSGNSYVLAEIPELPEWALPGRVERWEDVAALEADASSGEDSVEFATTAVENVDKLREIQTKQELDAFTEQLDPSQRLVLSNEIATKNRELLHDQSIRSDNS